MYFNEQKQYLLLMFFFLFFLAQHYVLKICSYFCMNIYYVASCVVFYSGKPPCFTYLFPSDRNVDGLWLLASTNDNMKNIPLCVLSEPAFDFL